MAFVTMSQAVHRCSKSFIEGTEYMAYSFGRIGKFNAAGENK